MTKEWFNKNLGGILATSLVGLLLYALGAYITSAISKEMKGYVPVTIWNQWAQERGEWRGKVDQRLENLEKEMNKQRDEILKELRENTKQVAVQTQMIADVKDQLKSHMNGLKP